MTEVENQMLALLRQMRSEQASFREEVLARFDAIETRFAAVEARQQAQDKKLDKLGVDLMGVRGRVKAVEDAITTIARVVSDQLNIS